MKQKVQNIHEDHQIYNAIPNKFNMVSCYNDHGTMILFDTILFLSQSNFITNSLVQIIIVFSTKTHKKFYI